MAEFTRRRFILTGSITGAVVASGALTSMMAESNIPASVDTVELGKTGLKVTRLAMGMGTNGWNHQSNQTRIGLDKFKLMVKAGFDRGIRFLDTADTYGSHPFAKEALRLMPREQMTVMTKIWTENLDWHPLQPVDQTIERMLQELGTDYLDIVLLHCMTKANWTDEKKRFMDGLSEAKSRGLIKKVGFSAHDFGALESGVNHEWPDIVLARINNKQIRMDGEPEKILSLLDIAGSKGKGVLGMKIFGCGGLVKEEERMASLNYVIKSNKVHAMTIGFEDATQVHDTVDRLMGIVKAG
ncbi:MAG TPA: aldo/keto reductase [Prolixibacteraceae bacterium]|nr:aldo/keto reductase [Prolixibacteraceae bacterium]